MWSKHAHLSLRVFSHEVVIQSVIELVCLLLVPDPFLIFNHLPLLFCQLSINLLGIALILIPNPIMIRLSLPQSIIEVESLGIKELIDLFIQIFLHVPLFYLLLAPVLLL